MTRHMFDSATAADIPAGSELVMGYVDGSSKWSDADWQRFPGRKLVRLCIFNDRMDAQVIDLEPGNNDARGAIPWIREKWLRGETPTVYCFSDLGPHGYTISDVRSECDAASLRHPLFLITDFDNDPTLPNDPEVIGKQYANAALTGAHYDASVVRDFWPGIDKEDDMASPQQLYDSIASIIQEKIVAPQVDTNTAIKNALALLAAHQQANAGDLAAGVTVRVLVSLEKVLTNTAPPVPPSCPDGTRYFGESADGSVVGWTYPDGTTHYFRDGVEATA